MDCWEEPEAQEVVMARVEMVMVEEEDLATAKAGRASEGVASAASAVEVKAEVVAWVAAVLGALEEVGRAAGEASVAVGQVDEVMAVAA